MASESTGLRESINAGEDLRSCEYHAVKLDSNGDIVKGSAGAKCSGIVQNNPNHDEAGSVMYAGVTPAMLGGTVTPGQDLASDANGHLVAAVAGDQIVAQAMESGSSGEEITVLVKLTPPFAPLKEWWIFYMPLADISAADIVTEWIPGFAGKITKILAIVQKAATTAAKAATLNAEIETTDLTGGALALTSANCTPKGAQVEASAITAANAFTAAQKISVEASSVTAFVEGSIWLMVQYERT